MTSVRKCARCFFMVLAAIPVLSACEPNSSDVLSECTDVPPPIVVAGVYALDGADIGALGFLDANATNVTAVIDAGLSEVTFYFDVSGEVHTETWEIGDPESPQ